MSGIELITPDSGAYVPTTTNGSTFNTIYPVFKVNPSTAGIAPFELVEHTTNFAGTDDQTAFVGWNVERFAGGGNTSQPAWGIGFEFDYNNGSGQAMEYYLQVTSSDGSVSFRPIYVGASRDAANSHTAAVIFDLGTATSAEGARQFTVEVGVGVPVFTITPDSGYEATLSCPLTIQQDQFGSAGSLVVSGSTGNGGAIILGGTSGAAFQFQVATNNTQMYITDQRNSGRNHIILTGGTSNTTAVTDFYSNVGLHGNFGAYGVAPVAQPSAAGTATGYAAGATAATFHSDDTYTGNTGTTGYTINGIVAALKNLGLIAA